MKGVLAPQTVRGPRWGVINDGFACVRRRPTLGSRGPWPEAVRPGRRRAGGGEGRVLVRRSCATFVFVSQVEQRYHPQVRPSSRVCPSQPASPPDPTSTYFRMQVKWECSSLRKRKRKKFFFTSRFVRICLVSLHRPESSFSLWKEGSVGKHQTNSSSPFFFFSPPFSRVERGFGAARGQPRLARRTRWRRRTRAAAATAAAARPLKYASNRGGGRGGRGGGRGERRAVCASPRSMTRKITSKTQQDEHQIKEVEPPGPTPPTPPPRP